MSTTTFLKDAAIRHSIYVQRFAGGEVKETFKLLQELEKEIQRKIKLADPATANARRLSVLSKQIKNTIENAYSNIGKRTLKEMQEFGEYEAGFTQRLYEKASTAEIQQVANNTVKAAVAAQVMEVGKEKIRLDTVFEKLGAVKAKEIVQQVKGGVVAGLTTTEIAKDILRSMKGINRRQAETLVRTTTNHISQLARDLTIAENSDIVDRELFVATLDGRTTSICGSLDGKTFAEGEGPKPPLHWNCRSTRIPVVKKEYQLPLEARRPSVGADGAEVVKGTTTYNSWLKGQPKAFQEDALGVTKAKLFREGGLKLDKFVDRNFKEYTIADLRRKEPRAFEKAGLSE